jgi:hypothetical protein
MDGMTLAHGSVEHEYGLRLSAKHADLLRASGVSVEVAREREYVTVDTKVALKKLGFGPSQQIDPALVVPIWSVTGERVGSQIRPDEPRYGNNGNSRNDPEKADLRWVINEGHRRGATVPGCVGANRDVIEEFPMYAPLALAGIGALPDTLASRSITIAMRRRTVAEPVEQFRQRQANEQLAPLRERIEAWAETIRPRLRGFVPVMPTGVEDRAADCWEPLLSIAELAGRVWTNEARAACVELVRVSREASASLGVRLLRDCKGGDERCPGDHHGRPADEALTPRQRAVGESARTLADERDARARVAELIAEIGKVEDRLAQLDAVEQRAAEAEATYQRLASRPVTARGAGRLSDADTELDRAFRSAILSKNPAPIDVATTRSTGPWPSRTRSVRRPRSCSATPPRPPSRT